MIGNLTHNINLFYKTIESSISTFKQDRAIKQAFSKGDALFDIDLSLNVNFKRYRLTYYKLLEKNQGIVKRIKSDFSKFEVSVKDRSLRLKQALSFDLKKSAVIFSGLCVTVLVLYLVKNISISKPVITPVDKKISKVVTSPLSKDSIKTSVKQKLNIVKVKKKTVKNNKTLKSENPLFAGLEKLKPKSDIIKEEPKVTAMKSELFSGNEYVLLASKKEKKLFVLKNHDNGSLKVVEKYTASFGKLSGDKNKEGDLRTPEGFYKIIKFKPKKELSEIFGPMAFVLNYPNDLDIKLGKTGSNIWIHGTGMNKVTPDTKGCVEISDPDIINLSQYIDVETETPIIILPEKYTVKGKFTDTDNNIAESFIRDMLSGEAKI